MSIIVRIHTKRIKFTLRPKCRYSIINFSDTPSDERKLLAKDYIGETYDFQLTEFRGPEIISPEKRMEQEEELFFTPCTSPIDIVEKMEEGQEPRFPEEEGMYIGIRPSVKKSNQNKVENR